MGEKLEGMLSPMVASRLLYLSEQEAGTINVTEQMSDSTGLNL